jgi:hypothetical protein
MTQQDSSTKKSSELLAALLTKRFVRLESLSISASDFFVEMNLFKKLILMIESIKYWYCWIFL